MDDLYSEPTPVEHQQIRGGSLRQVRTRKAAAPITMPIGRIVPLGPETSWSFFHPNRVGAKPAPAAFAAEVRAIDPNLAVAWHPIHERWCVWVKNPRITHWICAGWQLLFPVKYPDGSYMPLDARTLAEIVNRSPRKWGNGLRYFERVYSEIQREKRAAKQHHSDIVGQNARDRWDFAQIKVSMAGPSSGSKFTTHHSGN